MSTIYKNGKCRNCFLTHLGMLFSVLLFCQSCFAGICVNTSANREMYRGADTLIRGYDVAFQDSHFTDYQFFSADTNADFVTQLQKMVSGSCSVVLGLFTSRECLIAGPILRQYQAIGISPLCAHDDVSKFYPYLYTAAYQLSKEENFIIDYLNGLPNLGKVFVIYQPANLYSASHFTQFKKGYTKPIIEVPIDSDDQFDLSKITYQKDEKVTLVFFTYPLPSVEILMALHNRQLINKNVRILGVSSWFDDFSVLKSIKPIFAQAGAVVAPDDLEWGKIKNSSFVKMFAKRFHREPLNVEVLNYDITMFTIKCYKEALINGKYNVDVFRHCLTNTKYQGVAGEFAFSSKSAFANRPLYMINLLDRI